MNIYRVTFGKRQHVIKASITTIYQMIEQFRRMGYNDVQYEIITEEEV